MRAVRLRRPTRRPTRVPHAGPPTRLLAPLAALAAAAFVGGCDNPACVFGPGNCQGGAGGPGGALAAEAFAPPDGVWIADGAPAVNDVLPEGTGVATSTPVVLFFSESLVPSTTTTAFRLERDSDFGAIPVPATSSLVGDGRVLVLLPQVALEPSTTYRVFYSSTANARDYTGQSLSTAPGAQLGVFTTAATDPVAPRVVATFPRDNATLQSATGEFVVVFDRKMVAAGFAGNGFQVTVGGSPPAADPAPAPLTLGGGILGPTDTRVWRWRSVDGSGEPVPLGNAVQVAVSLSPGGAKLAAEGGGELPATIVDYTTAPFAAPVSAELASSPADAIGIANLVPGGGDDLALTIELEGAQTGDRVDVFLFGNDFEDDPHLVALQRNVAVGADPSSVTIGLGALDLTTSTSPLQARFADGELLIAVRVQRGGAPSPVTRLDVDPDEDGDQGPVLDTVRPKLEDLLAPGGGGDLFRSDLDGLVLAGTASEPVRRVAVTTDLGDNGPSPDVVGADASGFFVARPVPLGILDSADQPLGYEFVLFDRALNASATIAGLYRQLGAANGGALVPDGGLVVEVFDALSLKAIQGARVVTHADLGDASAYPLLGAETTDATGLAAVPAHPAGAAGTIVTVDAPGYDRLTFHGVASARLSLPLARTPAPAATLNGVVASTGVFASLTLPTADLAIDDTRRSVLAAPTVPVGACTGGPFGQGLACPFGPVPITPLHAGARAFIAGDFALAEANFSAASLIKAFELAPARRPAGVLGVTVDPVDVEALLNEPGVPADALPVALPVASAEALFASGVDLGALVDDPQFGVAPRVVVELLLAGQHAPLAVGLGIAYPTASPTTWNARAAYPGAAFTLAAELGDPTLLMRLVAEWRDTHGALSRVSLGLSEVAGFSNILFAPPVPVATSPAPDEVLAGASFDVVVPNTLLDGLLPGSPDGAGLYRVRLVEAGGRGWTLWRPDVADSSPEVRVHVPDLTGAGGAGLASGAVTLETASFAYGGFDPAAFLFSDIELRAQFRTQSAPRTVQVP